MPLSPPRLDDRSFADLRREALERIPRQCSAWTDLNASDPGITLLELMAWLTEIMLYRINRIPERDYIVFLDLLGVHLQPAQSARAWVVFRLARNPDEAAMPRVRQGTRMATPAAMGTDPIPFETVEDLQLTAARPVAAVAQVGEDIRELPASLLAADAATPAAREPLFGALAAATHMLYLAARTLSPFERGARIELRVTLARELALGQPIEWEVWTGSAWAPWIPLADATAGLSCSGSLVFEAPAAHQPGPPPPDLAGRGPFGLWARGRLLGLYSAEMPEVTDLQLAVSLPADHAGPLARALLRDARQSYRELDLSAPVAVLGEAPVAGCILYLQSRHLAGPGNVVRLDFELADPAVAAPARPRGDAVLAWEYFTADQEWRYLGEIDPTTIRRRRIDFEDTTAALTRSGSVSFRLPENVARPSLLGEQVSCVRVRLISGQYGEDHTGRPVAERIRLSYAQPAMPWDAALGENHGEIDELLPDLTAGRGARPFRLVTDATPMLYIALDRAMAANRPQRLFIRMQPRAAVGAHVIWEYADRDGWSELHLIADATAALSRTGPLDFIAPGDWTSARHFGRTGFWLRARFIAGTAPEAPVVLGITTNVAEVLQAEGITDEILGASSGEPNQTFRFAQRPLLPDPVIEVRESQNPDPDVIEHFRIAHAERLREERDAAGRVVSLWVRWTAVDSLLDSGPSSRHYLLDLHEGGVTFGDGKRGMIPPSGRDAVRARCYSVGGGRRGNVGRGRINALDQPIAGVDSVFNPDPAAGGADPETLDDAKLRGPWALKHRHRAVTAQDFERLACEATTQVARALCRVEAGVVTLVIVPDDAQPRPQPSYHLVQRVRAYLDDRRLVTTRLQVVGPSYLQAVGRVDVRLRADEQHRFSEVATDIRANLAAFVHPLHGGPDGTGWPIGRSLYVSELYQVLEKLPPVDFVRKIRIRPLAGEHWQDAIAVPPRSYPDWSDIRVDQI